MVVWDVSATNTIGGHAVELVGHPRVEDTDKGKAVCFDGQGDALLLSTNPIEGAGAFTVEMLFRPDAGGTVEQRFFHIQEDAAQSRVLLELRMPAGGEWYADTFIQARGGSCALNDPKLLHPAGKWHTLALVCDGQRMTQYVNGVKELERMIGFSPMRAGKTSLGMRINRVHWFKGAIRQVRITPRALAPGELLKP